MTSILVLAPHPDDEIVGCGVALRRAIAQGASAHVLYFTTGVPSRETFWPWQRPSHPAGVARRREEALAVAAEVGLSPVRFLALPSRSLKAHLRDATDAVVAAIAERSVDVLWTPAWEGAHQDHDVANFIAAQFAARLPVIEFAEYNFAGGAVRSGRFAAPGPADQTLRLTDDEVAWKRRLLARYRSERGNLAHIKSATEALRPLPAHDYAQRPHAGRLFYERFHWVPFRHPRVDLEKPEAVSAVLAAAMSRAGSAARSS